MHGTYSQLCREKKYRDIFLHKRMNFQSASHSFESLCPTNSICAGVRHELCDASIKRYDLMGYETPSTYHRLQSIPVDRLVDQEDPIESRNGR